MRISDWSSDVCSSDLGQLRGGREAAPARSPTRQPNASILWAAGWGSGPVSPRKSLFRDFPNERPTRHHARSEEHTSELQSLMRISYAVFCLKKKTTPNTLSHHIARHSHTYNQYHTKTPSNTRTNNTHKS